MIARPKVDGCLKTTDTEAVCCPVCGDELVLHQPDGTLAGRLLATCGGCKAWFLTGPRLRFLKLMPGTVRIWKPHVN
jgi:hypothetical protein